MRLRATLARDYLYGTGIYTDTSSVCTDAQHAGLVGPSGGAIEVIGAKEDDSYEGSVQNDVASKSWGPGRVPSNCCSTA